MSKLVDNLSLPSTKSELNLFSLPPTQVAVERSEWREVLSQNPVTNDGPYEFHIPPDPQFLHLAKNYLYIEMQIVPTQPPAAADEPFPKELGPINLIGKTFIRQAKLMLNGTEVYDSGDNYAFRAYFETLLNYGSDETNSYLQAACYYPDQEKKHDEDDNSGLALRNYIFAGKNNVQLMAPLHLDLAHQERYLLNQMDVRLKLYRNSDAFCLQNYTDTAHKFTIKDMRLYVKMVELVPSLSVGIERTLASYTAKYPIRRVEVKTLHVSAGSRDTPGNPLFSGQLPRRLIIACVQSDNYNGTIKSSPFKFHHFDVSEIYAVVGGRSIPSVPLRPDYDKWQFTRTFASLFEAMGMLSENRGIKMSQTNFIGGYAIYVLDATPDFDDAVHWNLIRDGSTSIHLHFNKPIPPGNGIEVIVYAEFDNLVVIDQNRNTFIDYQT